MASDAFGSKLLYGQIWQFLVERCNIALQCNFDPTEHYALESQNLLFNNNIQSKCCRPQYYYLNEALPLVGSPSLFRYSPVLGLVVFLVKFSGRFRIVETPYYSNETNNNEQQKK